MSAIDLEYIATSIYENTITKTRPKCLFNGYLSLSLYSALFKDSKMSSSPSFIPYIISPRASLVGFTLNGRAKVIANPIPSIDTTTKPGQFLY